MASEESIFAQLKRDFPKSTIEDWKRAASQELNGKDPYVALRWKSQDDIEFLPYYDREGVASLNYLDDFKIFPAEDSFLGPRKWLNMPNVIVSDENEANKISLNHLVNGADGIIFSFDDKKRVLSALALDKLLNNIELQYCNISFEVAEENFSATLLSDFISKKYNDPSQITGSLFWETIPEKKSFNFFFYSAKNFKGLGIKIRPSCPAREIAEAITLGEKAFRAHHTDKNAFDVFAAVNFSMPVETNFFESIAKIKALRQLWFQVARAYGFSNYQPSDLWIHGRSEPWANPTYQPHGNMIKATTSTMAAIFGGCSSVTTYPEQETNETMARHARNVSNVLREESHLNKVSDAVAGAYVIQKMQHEIAEKAWSIFQSNLKND